jgi:hypothetical protein
MSHAASKVYPHAHRDIANFYHLPESPLVGLDFMFHDGRSQDLTRLESGNETSLNVRFNLPAAIEEAIRVYRNKAGRQNLEFKLNISGYPKMVVGDPKKIKTVVANLTANSLKPTHLGHIFSCSSNDATNS